ncbi:hypothetical protein F4804DRAFT_336288 [Jackrogersella minutella]|nr:hypothetical protein F4804DRAFT_336288 [Jackrogersella minutella]
MAALSTKHYPINLASANSDAFATSARLNHEPSNPSQPARRHAKSKSLRRQILTSLFVKRLFSSQLSQLQFPKKSHTQPDKDIFLEKSAGIFRTKTQRSVPHFVVPSKSDMTLRHNFIACKAVSSRPVTVVATSYGTDGQLRNDVISGSSDKQHPANYDLPDEGIFIVYRNRALQIAAPPCDQRKCNTTQLCHCHNPHPQFSTQGVLLGHRGLKQRAPRWPIWKPCCHCLFNWLHLYLATEAAKRLSMKCLQHPRSLTLADVHGHEAFYYDAELEEQYIRSKTNGAFLKSADGKSPCPPRLFEWMKDAWNDFMKCGCCKPGSITSLPDSEGDTHSEYSAGSEQSSSECDSDWDDLDVPYKRASTTSIPSECDDYDLIDDLIDKEFPKLRKSSSFETKTSDHSKAEPSPHLTDNNGFVENEEDDVPVPVIIPPKNMAVGKEIRIFTESTSSISVPLRNHSPILYTSCSYSKPTPSLGTKRSYQDLVRSGQCDPQKGEDLTRAKQRRLDFAVSNYGDRYRHNSIAYDSLTQLNQGPPTLILA